MKPKIPAVTTEIMKLPAGRFRILALTAALIVPATIHAATITKHAIATTAEPIDCLLDAMITAQKTLGQISWVEVTMDSAHGTYRDATTQTTETVTVIDVTSRAIETTVQDWLANAS